MSKYGNHQVFLKEVMLYIQSEYKDIRLWQTATGQAYAKFSVKNALFVLLKTRDINKAMKSLIVISYGVKGHPDLVGIYFGRWIGIEIKTGKSKQSQDQKYFQKMIQDKQGIYLVVSNNYPIPEQLGALDEMRSLCLM